MVDLKDQLRNPNYANSSAFARAYMTEAADRIAALEAQLTERVKVKPLEWEERVGVDGTFDAYTSIGHYIATITDDDRGMWFAVGLTQSNYCAPDIDIAKAAAQADYERRILAALEPAEPARAAEPVAWLHEIKEPDGGRYMLSRSSENPWSHWIEKYREQCTYSATPLYARPSPSEARRPAEQAVTEAMIARASAEHQAIFGKYLLSSHARRILKAAMEAGHADR